MSETETSRNWLIRWLIRNYKPLNTGLCDFVRLSKEVKPCDVLLIEGRSRIGEIIKALSQSPWSHSVLYIGKLDDIKDRRIRSLAAKFVVPEERNKALILEALFGKGVVLSPLEKYEGEHIRICRPINLLAEDSPKVMNNALKNLGKKYNTRQIFDLLRFLLPIRILPRRWLSSLFRYKKGARTEEICSSMLVNAFTHVGFPIRPIIKIKNNKEIQFFRRNPLLFTPSDFDYSPYFEIIKYPIFGNKQQKHYSNLTWSKKDDGDNNDHEVFTIEE